MKKRLPISIGSTILTCGLWLAASADPAAADESAPTWVDRARAVAARRLNAMKEAPVAGCPLRRDPSLSRTVPDARRRPQRAGSLEVETFCLAADEAAPSAAEAAPATQAAATRPTDVERGPLPGLGDTLLRDLKEAPRLLWHDTKKVYTDPCNLVFLVGAGGASLALRPEVDDDIEDYYDRHHTFDQDWRDAFGALGNPAAHFGFAAAWYLLGQTTQDAKTYEVGKRAVSALSITGVTTVLLKLAACTESPNGEDWAWPSGHVSSTMALATVLNDAYGPLVGVPMFGLTGLVALERLDDREHHFSDVIFGAALGWVVAETVMKEHRPEVFGGQIAPYIDPAGRNAGVAWIKTLGP